VTFRYQASAGYFSYVWTRRERGIGLEFSGSGAKARIRILMPPGATPSAVKVDGTPAQFDIERIAGSSYVRVESEAQRGDLAVEFR
jgi:hypothetical protein